MAEGELPAMKRIWAYWLFAAVLFAQEQAGVIAEFRDSKTLIQDRVVPRQDLTVAGAVKAAKAFLADGPERKLGVLTMYVDSSAAAEQVELCENSYKQWKIFYENFPKAQFRAAQLISTGDGAVLSVRADDGAVSRQVLGGTDPTRFEVDGAPFEILFAAGRTRSKFEGCGAGAIEPALYLKTSAALTPELCERTTGKLAEKLGSSHLSVGFRNDIWFLCSRFPVFYPFSAPGPIPTETAHRSSPEFTCSMTCDGVPKCVLTSGSLAAKSQPPGHR